MPFKPLTSKIFSLAKRTCCITSASVVPDTYFRTKQDLAAVEAEGLTAADLGSWLSEQHAAKLEKLLAQNGYEHTVQTRNPEEIKTWFERESSRLHAELKAALASPREAAAREALKHFRSVFHKPVIYASWNWNETVSDALHHAGFSSFEEQAEALIAQRKAQGCLY